MSASSNKASATNSETLQLGAEARHLAIKKDRRSAVKATLNRYAAVNVRKTSDDVEKALAGIQLHNKPIPERIIR